MLQNYQARLISKKRLAKNSYQFKFLLIKPNQIKFEAGQYLLLDVKGGYRQYSVSSPPKQTTILETIVDLSPMGIGSQYLLGLKTGQPVSFKAPLGLFVLNKTKQPKIFLATGAGISPIKAMLSYLFENQFKKPVFLFWGLKKEENLYLESFLARLKKNNPNFNYFFCFSKQKPRKQNCFSGHIQKALAKTKIAKKAEFYLCGRQNTVDSLKTFLLQNKKIPAHQIFHENFK